MKFGLCEVNSLRTACCGSIMNLQCGCFVSSRQNSILLTLSNSDIVFLLAAY